MFASNEDCGFCPPSGITVSRRDLFMSSVNRRNNYSDNELLQFTCENVGVVLRHTWK